MEKNVQEILAQNGASLLHFGLLVDNIEATMEVYKKIPGFKLGDWGDGVIILDTSWDEKAMVVGPPNSIRCVLFEVFGKVLVELVQPVHGKADGTVFEEYIKNQGEGPHHVAYKFETIEGFRDCAEYLKELGFEDVHHGRAKLIKTMCEYCYMKPPIGGMYIELNWEGDLD